MPTSHRITALAAALACAVLMTGCVGDPPAPDPSPDPTSTPVFASEEEALAAATEAYEAYQALSDQILSEGGVQPERIDRLAEGTAREDAYEAFSSFSEDRYRLLGRSAVTNVMLERFDQAAGAQGELAIYVCLDVGEVDVRDESDVSVVSPTRPSSQAFQASFDVAQNEQLILTSREPWTGEGVCD